MKRSHSALLAFGVGLRRALRRDPNQPVVSVESPSHRDSLAQYGTPAWFRDAKFGMMYQESDAAHTAKRLAASGGRLLGATALDHCCQLTIERNGNGDKP